MAERREDVKVIREDGYEQRQRVVEHSPSAKNTVMSRVNQFIWLLTAILEFVIGFRVILKLVGANAGNGFADFIYGVSSVFVTPFATLLQNPVLGDGTSVLEITSLIAMVVYFIVALVITTLIRILLLDTSSRSVKTVERI
ncbi:MAG: hypothetical protein Phog2KO_13300 [Phototrophicaceae bacterium]